MEKERGMPACPLTVSWVCGQPKTQTTKREERERREEREGSVDGREGAVTMEEVGGGEDRDYESIVLMKLRQAEERKRLCEELANSADT